MTNVNGYAQQLWEHLQAVDSTCSSVKDHKWKIEPLLSLNLHFARVVNFGCSIGYETLGLTWYLDAREVVGIDKKWSSIDLARAIAQYFSESIEGMWRTLLYVPEISEELRSQAEEFVREYRNRSMPTFKVANFTQHTDLPDNHFDLAYCERVLYHIACDDTQSAMNDVQTAVREMARVIVPGGLVVAIEPCTCLPDDTTPLWLDQFFFQAGLTKLEIDKDLFSLESKRVYMFSKPSGAA